jgi:phage terminase large subunit-like protein
MTSNVSELMLGSNDPRIHTPFASEFPTRGNELIELAIRLEQPLMPWQELVAIEAHRYRPDGRWAFSQTGILVSRQNGKSHIMRLRIIQGLTEWKEKLQILSAHKLAISLEHFNQIVEYFENYDDLSSQVKNIRRVNGQEEITMLNGSRFKVVANNAAGRGYAGAESIYLD